MLNFIDMTVRTLTAGTLERPRLHSPWSSPQVALPCLWQDSPLTASAHTRSTQTLLAKIHIHLEFHSLEDYQLLSITHLNRKK